MDKEKLKRLEIIRDKMIENKFATMGIGKYKQKSLTEYSLEEMLEAAKIDFKKENNRPLLH